MTPNANGSSPRTTAAARADTATIEPNDRSISPADRTNTTPTASTVAGAVCRTMFDRLRTLAKPYRPRVTVKKTKIARKPR